MALCLEATRLPFIIVPSHHRMLFAESNRSMIPAAILLQSKTLTLQHSILGCRSTQVHPVRQSRDSNPCLLDLRRVPMHF